MLQTNYQNQTTKIKKTLRRNQKSNHAQVMIIHAHAQTDCNCKEIFARKIGAKRELKISVFQGEADEKQIRSGS